MEERKRGLEEWINAALDLFGCYDPHLSEFLVLDAANADKGGRTPPPPALIIDVSISHREVRVCVSEARSLGA